MAATRGDILAVIVPTAPLVLVVDDDVDTREMYGWCLEGHGFRVQLVGSVAAALAHTAVEIPAVVITDFTLPGGDGFTLADAMRGSVDTAHVRLVLVSGRTFLADDQERARTLFDRVLLKPVLPDDLAGHLAALDVTPR